MQSRAATVAEYLKSLPAERRAVVSAVRRLILDHLPAGYQELMGFGMICYGIPLSHYPYTHNGQPLVLVSLAAQKNHYALYMMCVYLDSRDHRAFSDAFRAAGKRLDMGKSCVRFQRLDDLALEVIGETIAHFPVEAYLQRYEAVKGAPAPGTAAKRPAARAKANGKPKASAARRPAARRKVAAR